MVSSAETLATPIWLPENRQERVLFEQAAALWETPSKDSIQTQENPTLDLIRAKKTFTVRPCITSTYYLFYPIGFHVSFSLCPPVNDLSGVVLYLPSEIKIQAVIV